MSVENNNVSQLDQIAAAEAALDKEFNDIAFGAASDSEELDNTTEDSDDSSDGDDEVGNNNNKKSTKKSKSKPKKKSHGFLVDDDEDADDDAGIEEDLDDDDDIEKDDVEGDPDDEEDDAPKENTKEGPPKKALTHAEKTARKQGRLRKELEVKLAISEEEKVSYKTKIQEHEAELKKLQKQIETHEVEQSDVSSSPRVKKAVDKAAAELYEGVLYNVGRKEAVLIQNHLYDVGKELFLAQNLNIAEKTKVFEEAVLYVAQKIDPDIDSDVKSLDDLDTDIYEDTLKKAREIVKVAKDKAGRYEEIIKAVDEASTQKTNHFLTRGYDEYEKKAKEIKSNLDSISKLSQEQIDEDPDSIESLVATKINLSAKAKEEREKTIDNLTQVILGPRVLSQKEVDEYLKTGKDLEAFQKVREKRVHAMRTEQIPILANLIALLPEIKEALPDWLKRRREQNTAEEKRDVLSNRSVKKSKPEAEKKELTPDEVFNKKVFGL